MPKFRKKKKKNIKMPIPKLIVFLNLIFLFLYLKKNKRITNKTKVAMCVIAKKENRYIKYFVEFYKKLGYDHIYFYDNNDQGEECIKDVPIVNELMKTGYITIIDYKNKQGPFVTQSYYDCYEAYNKEYDWISFFDIDEFLILEPKNISIQDFLENKRYKDCDSIKFNWRIFNDNGQLDYENKSLMERFPIESKHKLEYRGIKVTARGRLNYSNYKRNYSPHSLWNNIKVCSSSGKKVGWESYLTPPDLEFASLNHYVTKSVREFFYKKYKSKVDVDTISQRKKNYLFNYFFCVNEQTQEKIDIFNEIYHTNYKLDNNFRCPLK